MAVFDERRELNKQKKHTAARWDDSFGIKALGFNKFGKDNAFGQVLNFIPGVNTARHALAKGVAGKDTKKVLDDTFDETVGRDLAGLAFGIDLAKTIGTGGLSNLGGIGKGIGKGIAGGAGKGLLGGNKMPSGNAADVAQGLSGGQGGVEADSDIMSGFKQKAAGVLVNPYKEGTPEFDQFESTKMEQEGGLFNKVKSQAKNTLGSALGGGNVFASGANYLAQSIGDYKAGEEAFKKYSRGSMSSSSPFNFL